MKLYLFDDDKLLNRINSRRIYGDPKPLPDKRGGKIIKGSPLGPYLAYYDVRVDKGELLLPPWQRKHLIHAAVSDDCLNWEPLGELTYKKDDGTVAPIYPGFASTIHAAVYDESAGEEKYRLVCVRAGETKMIPALLYSEDGLCFSRKDTNYNGDATEGLSNYFYHREKKSWCLTIRRHWGERGAGIKETKDFMNYTKWQPVIMPDSEDLPMDEVYGLVSTDLDELYIGMLSIYHTPYQEDTTWKFRKGRLETQLAYSYDGNYFLRSLRRPFIKTDDLTDPSHGCFFPNEIVERENDVLIFGGSTREEHGMYTKTFGTAYSIQKDRFCGLESCAGDADITTRPILYDGGDITINISVPYGEAVCEIRDRENKPIEGFTFEDCQPFAGDDIYWKPKWQSHKISELKGKPLMIKLRWFNGVVWTMDIEGRTIKSHIELALY